MLLGPAPLFRLRGRERQVLVVKAEQARARCRRWGRRSSESPAERRAPASTSASTSIRSRRSLGSAELDQAPLLLKSTTWRKTKRDLPTPSPRISTPRSRPSRPSSIRRSAHDATRRCATSASSATRCCAPRRCPSSASTQSSPRRPSAWGELMHDALGVGLAATQLGVLHRLLVYKAYLDDPLTVLVNPKIEWASEEREVAEEGCLSLPGIHVEVERHVAVRVSAKDEHGRRPGGRGRGSGCPHHPARDRSPRRCADPRSHLTSGSQGGDAQAA